MDIFLGISGVLWLIFIAYVNAFIVEPPHDNLWWLVRPWATLGTFTGVTVAQIGSMAILTTQTTLYVRATQICLGTIAANGKRWQSLSHSAGNTREANDREESVQDRIDSEWDSIMEKAQKDLQAFSLVRDLPFIRVMGNVVDVSAVTKFFYILAVLFVLPVVSQSSLSGVKPVG